jgi:two-component system chemotaxis response regulator CheY
MASILLLEDNLELRNLLQQALEYNNFQILAGASGVEGLQLLENTRPYPDAIICDINMPEMDGVTFIRHVRAHPEWSKAYVIILSGQEDDHDMALSAGADAFIQKPFSVLGLTNLISKQLGA